MAKQRSPWTLILWGALPALPLLLWLVVPRGAPPEAPEAGAPPAAPRPLSAPATPSAPAPGAPVVAPGAPAVKAAAPAAPEVGSSSAPVPAAPAPGGGPTEERAYASQRAKTKRSVQQLLAPTIQTLEREAQAAVSAGDLETAQSKRALANKLRGDEARLGREAEELERIAKESPQVAPP